MINLFILSYKWNLIEAIIKKGHRKYTIEIKQKILELIHLNYSLHFLSNKLGIDKSVFRDWIKKENLILEVKNKDKKYRCNRVQGLNTFFNDENENKIYSWIFEKRSNHLPISIKSIIVFAGTIDETFSIKTLNARLQWAYRFIKLYKLSIRLFPIKGKLFLKQKKL